MVAPGRDMGFDESKKNEDEKAGYKAQCIVSKKGSGLLFLKDYAC